MIKFNLFSNRTLTLRGCPHIMSANFGGFQIPSLDLKNIVAMQKEKVQLVFFWTVKMIRFNFLRQLADNEKRH